MAQTVAFLGFRGTGAVYLTRYPRLSRDSKNEWNAKTGEYGFDICGGRSLHENTGFDQGVNG